MKQVNFRLSDDEHAALATLSASVKMSPPALVLAIVRDELAQASYGGGFTDTLRCSHPGCEALREGRSDYCLPHAMTPRCASEWCARPVTVAGTLCSADHTEPSPL